MVAEPGCEVEQIHKSMGAVGQRVLWHGMGWEWGDTFSSIGGERGREKGDTD